MIIKTRPLQATVFVPASYFNPNLVFVATASSINISLGWAVKNYNFTELEVLFTTLKSFIVQARWEVTVASLGNEIYTDYLIMKTAWQP